MKKFSITIIVVLMLLATTLYAEHGDKEQKCDGQHKKLCQLATDKNDTGTSTGDGCCGKAKTCDIKDAKAACPEKDAKAGCPEKTSKEGKTCSGHGKKCAKTAAKTKPQTTCPVMGSQINKKIYTDYQGQRVYFCCPMCKGPFAKDPEKYFKKIAESKVVLKSVQKKCTVTGKPIDRKNYVDYKGRRVYFCTSECQISFKEKPKKHLEKLNRQSKGKG